MKKSFIATLVALIITGIYAATASVKLHQAETDREQIKQDVRQLCNDIDNYGDIDTFSGSDHFEHLYKWSHDI